MTTRISHFIVVAACGLILTGCRLADRPPWSPMQPTAQNPYGNQLTAGQATPGQDPFIQNSPHYAGRMNGAGGVGRVHIPSAGHPVPNMNYTNSGGSVIQAGYQTPAQPAPNYMPPRRIQPQYQPPRRIEPHPGIQPVPMPVPTGNWQQHQSATAGQVDSPFAPVH